MITRIPQRNSERIAQLERENRDLANSLHTAAELLKQTVEICYDLRVDVERLKLEVKKLGGSDGHIDLGPL
jgi:deoxyadenosine/deoxycytidine kinase